MASARSCLNSTWLQIRPRAEQGSRWPGFPAPRYPIARHLGHKDRKQWRHTSAARTPKTDFRPSRVLARCARRRARVLRAPGSPQQAYLRNLLNTTRPHDVASFTGAGEDWCYTHAIMCMAPLWKALSRAREFGASHCFCFFLGGVRCASIAKRFRACLRIPDPILHARSYAIPTS